MIFMKIVFTFLWVIGVSSFLCYSSYGHESALKTHTLCNYTGIIAMMDLERNFSGAVYTQGHYFNPSCRYDVLPGTANPNLLFFFPMNNCGTLVQESDGYISFSNTIVVQKHRTVQTLWDVLHNASCRFPAQLGRVFGRRNLFKNDEMESWMELKVGSDISIAKEANELRVGDEFLLIVHLKGGGQDKDLRVSSCWAHDEEILEHSQYSTQILDIYTCLPSGWISEFKSTVHVKNVSDKIAYASLKAFKFPSTVNLQITCSIQVCRNACLTYCDVPESSKHNHIIPLKKNKKRSAPASYLNGSIDKRLRLMKATIKALRATLLRNGKERARFENSTQFFKRISNSTSTKLLDTDGGVSEIATDKSDVGTIFGKDENITKGLPDYDTDSVIATEYNSEPIWNNVYHFNLTTKILVLSSRQFDNKYMLDSSRLISNCISRLRFNLVTTILTFILFCLILTCIALCLYLRKEKKKHLIDNFLLYNFY